MHQVPFVRREGRKARGSADVAELAVAQGLYGEHSGGAGLSQPSQDRSIVCKNDWPALQKIRGRRNRDKQTVVLENASEAVRGPVVADARLLPTASLLTLTI